VALLEGKLGGVALVGWGILTEGALETRENVKEDWRDWEALWGDAHLSA
jgi:hypothetical protein